MAGDSGPTANASIDEQRPVLQGLVALHQGLLAGNKESLYEAQALLSAASGAVVESIFAALALGDCKQLDMKTRLTQLETGLKQATEYYGEEHEVVVYALSRLAYFYHMERGDPVYGEGLYRSCLSKLEALRQPNVFAQTLHLRLLRDYANMLDVSEFNGRGRVTEAKQTREKLQTLQEQSPLAYSEKDLNDNMLWAVSYYGDGEPLNTIRDC
jgi:hypothetical protein